MNDKWLNDIHDRMSEFEIDEPVNLWNDIRSHQPDRKKSAVGAIKPWAKRMMSIAALIAIVFTAVYLTHLNHKVTVPEKTNISEAVRPVMIEGTAINPEPETQESRTEHRQTSQRHMPQQKVYTKTAPDTYCPPAETATETVAENQIYENKQTDETDKNQVPSNDKLQDERRYKYDRPIRRPLPNKSKPGHVYLSIYTSGGYDYSASKKAISGIEYSSVGTNGATWEDKPMLGIMTLNQGRQIKSDIHHRLPIRTGISVAYRINDRVSLESGLSYTNLTSDIREGSDSHYLSGEQILHYVGIPINVKYRIASWKRLNTYASCGIIAEKCVSGKTDTKYIIDNHKLESETHRTMVKPIQWSANASAGVQLNISHAVGIYAEPGLSYYMDNGSSIKTIYKDKPLNFNLNIGLRFNLTH